MHGDLRPSNMLLPVRDHLELSDFDRAEAGGDKGEGGRRAVGES